MPNIRDFIALREDFTALADKKGSGIQLGGFVAENDGSNNPPKWLWKTGGGYLPNPAKREEQRVKSNLCSVLEVYAGSMFQVLVGKEQAPETKIRVAAGNEDPTQWTNPNSELHVLSKMIPDFKDLDRQAIERYDFTPAQLEKMTVLPGWKLDQTKKEEDAVLYLHELAFQNKLDAVKEVLAANVPITAFSKPGNNSILTAAARGNAVDVVEYLIQVRKLNPAFRNYLVPENALHKACRRGATELVKNLLAMPGMQIDMLTVDAGKSGLQLAIESGHFSLANDLMNLGADPHHADKDKKTLLTALITYFENDTDPFINKKRIRLQVGLCQLLMAKENPFIAFDKDRKPASDFITEKTIMKMQQIAPDFLYELVQLAKSQTENSNAQAFLAQYHQLESNQFKITKLVNSEPL